MHRNSLHLQIHRIVHITYDMASVNNKNFSLIARYLRGFDDNANRGYNYAGGSLPWVKSESWYRSAL